MNIQLRIFNTNKTIEIICKQYQAVMIGHTKAKIISWTDSRIEAISVRSDPKTGGTVRVYICNVGESNSFPGGMSLEITSVSGAFSSLIGNVLQCSEN